MNPSAITRVLMVRMSSLGDIIHTFPAATDLVRHVPGVELHWAVEGEYVDLARMHPGVAKVIPVALRRWRRAPFAAQTWRELGAARRALKEARYNAILDTQGLLKSVWVAKTARGPVHGFGRGTAREPFVSHFYDRTYEFAPSDHKIYRYRSVAAHAFDYRFDPQIDYGLAVPPAPSFAPRSPYVVLMHSTARAGKLWDESSWSAVARYFDAKGIVCVLPWGSADERERAERLAAPLTQSLVAPRMNIVEASGLLGHARAVIGLDTGFTHLAAALRVPVVGIFCDSEPVDAHPAGMGPTTYRGGVGKPPRFEEVVDALAQVAPDLV
jgi:heptosyltransferase I